MKNYDKRETGERERETDRKLKNRGGKKKNTQMSKQNKTNGWERQHKTKGGE